MNSGLNPPAHAEMPMCVMDGTDVETVVVTSEWTEIEMHAKQQTREDNSEDGADSPPAADCDQSESRSHGNTEESEIQTGKHTDSENCFRESTLMYNKQDESVGCTQDRTADTVQLECIAKERQSLTCSTTPPLDSVNAADGAAAFTILTGTRRSARKPKKTWKLKLVNLQKQKRKPGVVTRQKQERTPLASMRNSERVTEIDGACITSDNGSVHSWIFRSFQDF